MTSWINSLSNLLSFNLDLLSGFGGGRGGLHNEITHHGITLILLTILFVIVLGKHKSIPKDRQDKWLFYALCVGITESLITIIAVSVIMWKNYPEDSVFLYSYETLNNKFILFLFEYARQFFHSIFNIFSILYISSFFIRVFRATIKYTKYIIGLYVSLLIVNVCYFGNPEFFGYLMPIVYWPIPAISIIVTSIFSIYVLKDNWIRVPALFLVFIFIVCSGGLAFIHYRNNPLLLLPLINILHLCIAPILLYVYVRELLFVFEEKTIEAKCRLEESRTIIQGFSHELRTPLAGLTGLIFSYKKKFSKLSMANYGDHCKTCDRKSFLLSVINGAFSDFENIVMRISEIITNLHDYDKKTKKEIVTYENVRNLVETSIMYVKFTDSTKKMHQDTIIYKDMLNEAEAIAHISPSVMIQIMLNLLGNASYAVQQKKYVGSEKPEIVVSINASNENIYIEVRDNGIGMSKETIAKCTDRHYTTKKTGSGLGLFFIKNYIEDMKGTIGIFSEEGAGSSIKLTIPIDTDNSDFSSMRLAPRYKISDPIAIDMITDIEIYKGSMSDLSRYGGSFLVSDDIQHTSNRIIIEIPSKEMALNGTIAWKKDNWVGVKFDQNISDLLETLVSSSGNTLIGSTESDNAPYITTSAKGEGWIKR